MEGITAQRKPTYLNFLFNLPNASMALKPVFLPSAISAHIKAKPKVSAKIR